MTPAIERIHALLDDALRNLDAVYCSRDSEFQRLARGIEYVREAAAICEHEVTHEIIEKGGDTNVA